METRANGPLAGCQWQPGQALCTAPHCLQPRVQNLKAPGRSVAGLLLRRPPGPGLCAQLGEPERTGRSDKRTGIRLQWPEHRAGRRLECDSAPRCTEGPPRATVSRAVCACVYTLLH